MAGPGEVRDGVSGGGYYSEELGMCVLEPSSAPPEEINVPVSSPTGTPQTVSDQYSGSFEPPPSLNYTLASNPLFKPNMTYNVTERSVMEGVVEARLLEARNLMNEGSLDAARRKLGEAQQALHEYTKAHAEEPAYATWASFQGKVRLLGGEILDHSGKKKDHEKAVAHYKAALFYLNEGVKFDPMDTDVRLARARVQHHLTDYSAAMADYQELSRIKGDSSDQNNYKREIEYLANRFTAHRREAALIQDVPQQLAFLTEELKIAEALRDSEQVTLADPHPFNPDLGVVRDEKRNAWLDRQRKVEDLSSQLAVLTKANSTKELFKEVQSLVREGYLGPDQSNSSHYLVFSTGSDGKTKVELTHAFYQLSDAEKAAVLRDLKSAGALPKHKAEAGKYRWAAMAEGDPTRSEILQAKGLYHESRVQLMEGNLSAAKIAMVDFKKAASAGMVNDPELGRMDVEVRENLRTFTLVALAKLSEANESLKGQRGSHFFGSSSGKLNADFLKSVEDIVSSGKADTLDEALGVIRGDYQRLHGMSERNPVVVEKGQLLEIEPLRLKRNTLDYESYQKAVREFMMAFRQDPQATRLGIMNIRVDGGALVLPCTGFHNDRNVFRVVVGPAGGTVRVNDASGDIYEFPPSDHDRVVVVHGNSAYSPHLQYGKDYRRGVHGGFAGTQDAGSVKVGYHDEGLYAFQTAAGRYGYRSVSNVVDDSDFVALFELETREGWERTQTTEGRREYLLSVAEKVRHRNGSYVIAGEILEGLFSKELENALSLIPQSYKDAVAQAAESERPQAEHEVKESLEQLKEKDEAAYLKRFPSGSPSQQELDAMVRQTIDGKVTIQLRKMAFSIIDDRHDHGRISDPVADKAWEIYDDMKDPLDKTWNLADETWDAIADEVVMTAVTMPVTMGVGSAIRAGASGTSLALRFAAQGGVRAFAMRSAIFLAGSLGEGVAMEGLKASLFGGEFSLKGVGLNMAMSVGFHGGGKLWGRAAKRMGVGEEAIEAAAKRGESTLGKRVVNATGTLTTQTGVSTIFGEAELALEDAESPQTFWERFGSHALRMVAMHYGTMAINVTTGNLAINAERKAALRMKVVEEGYKGLREKGMEKSPALDQAVASARDLVPSVFSETPGVANFVPIDKVKGRAEQRSEHTPESMTRQVLNERVGSSVVTDTPVTGEAYQGLRVIDHHGPFATPDGKNSTMKMLDAMEGALAAAKGNVKKAIRLLNMKEVTTDNLADGGWTVWIAKNQERILRDPKLRETIRQATHFEDFTAFGSKYDRGDSAVELQAAVFNRYNEILKANGIVGSDRFPPDKAVKVMDEALAAIDKMVGDPAARKAEAEKFWAGVDEATAAARGAVIQGTSVDGQVSFFDLGKLKDYPIFTQWLAIPQSHDLSLQATVAPMPPAKANGVDVSRTLTIVAIPNGRELATGKGLLSVVDVMNKAEAAKAKELGLEPNTWFGKDNVILPNPAKGGTLLTPDEISTLLRNPAHGLFHEKAMAPTDELVVGRDPEVTRNDRINPPVQPRVERARPEPRVKAEPIKPEPSLREVTLGLDVEVRANHRLEFFSDPQHQETLEYFARDGGRWGQDAKDFKTTEMELRTKLKRYNEIRMAQDEVTQTERGQLARDIEGLNKRLEGNGFYKMMLAYAHAGERLMAEVRPVTTAIASAVVEANYKTRESGGTPSADSALHFTPPTELRHRIAGDFRNATPQELVSVDVSVPDWKTANEVVQKLRGTTGLTVEHNTDLATVGQGNTGKNVAVRLPTGRTVEVRIRLVTPVEVETPAVTSRPPVKFSEEGQVNVEALAKRFKEHFGEEPDEIWLVGSRAEENPDEPPQDIDVIFVWKGFASGAAHADVNNRTGKGFDLIRDVNPQVPWETLRDPSKAHTRFPGYGYLGLEIPKQDFIDPFFFADRTSLIPGAPAKLLYARDGHTGIKAVPKVEVVAEASIKPAEVKPAATEPVAPKKDTSHNPLKDLEGLPWRQVVRRSWKYGVPIQNPNHGESIDVYTAPRVKNPVPPSREFGFLYERLSQKFSGYRSARRLNIRLRMIADIYAASPADVRLKIEARLKDIYAETTQTPQSLARSVYPHFRGALNNVIIEHGSKIGEVPIHLDTNPQYGPDKPQLETPGSLNYYTSREGLERILKSGRIEARAPIPGRQKKVYLASVALSPSEVERNIFIGNRAYKGKGNYVISFDFLTPRAVQYGAQIATSGGNSVMEMFVDSSLVIGRDIVIRYAGENPIIDEF